MNRRWLLLAALGLLIIANTIVLLGVAYNRSGTPDAVLQLTERELPLSWSGLGTQDNTGIALRLDYFGGEESWFDAAKLRAIGFDPDAYAHIDSIDRFKEPQSRRAYAVFEYDGPVWAARVKRAEDKLAALPARIAKGEATNEDLKWAQRELQRLRVAASRLTAVDAGPDPAALRARYPDRKRYLIAAVTVRMHQWYGDRKRGEHGEPRGDISWLLINSINLPARFHATLRHAISATGGKPKPSYGYGMQPPRYRVTLRYGRRYQPWVVDLQPVEKTTP